MTNPDINEISMQIARSLYLFVSFFGGLYIGYLFGRKDGGDGDLP